MRGQEHAPDILEPSQSPHELHEFGLRQVSRIERLMETTITNCAFVGSLAQFRMHLNTRDACRHLYFDTQDQALQKYEEMAEDVRSRLAPLFPDHGRRVNAASSCLVRGVETDKPSHHLKAQILKEESLRLLSFEPSTLSRNKEFMEGWVLYIQSLGQEIGVFRDPFEYFGSLELELMNAVWFTVDTFMHDKSWDSNQCFEYAASKLDMPSSQIMERIHHIKIHPGDACCGKLGQLKLKQLRIVAQETFGDDLVRLKTFHAVVLGSGIVSLDIVESNVQRWIRGETELARLNEKSRLLEHQPRTLVQDSVKLKKGKFSYRVICSAALAAVFLLLCKNLLNEF
ncbi:hypothetical protein BJ741DRAFT_637081 [Chytriomyces cf. hyalinus JEL632]|nr:hypothetical protein BJ741DRAFT_637081 [Chytriomyces cf. hyalinus JEL632]